jgi:hypothetical protein
VTDRRHAFNPLDRVELGRSVGRALLLSPCEPLPPVERFNGAGVLGESYEPGRDMNDRERIAAQIAAEPRFLDHWDYTLQEMPDGVFRATFYVPADDYITIINRCGFKPPVDCEVVYRLAEHGDKGK